MHILTGCEAPIPPASRQAMGHRTTFLGSTKRIKTSVALRSAGGISGPAFANATKRTYSACVALCVDLGFTINVVFIELQNDAISSREPCGPSGSANQRRLRFAFRKLDQVGLVGGKPLPGSLELPHAVPAILAFPLRLQDAHRDDSVDSPTPCGP